MKKSNETIFSTKGFYLGVAIFVFGLILMISRVALELKSYSKENTQQTIKTNDISENILKLQAQLDEKINQQETANNKVFNESIKPEQLKIYEHNPVLNKDGIITVVEFIDFGCPTCLVDANFTHRILKDNKNIKLISKLHNSQKVKKLHTANLASLVASKENKFFEFKEQQLLTPKNNLAQIITNLEKSGVSVRTFRQSLNNNSDILLSELSQDINQAENLNVNGYTVFINNRKFSDTEGSKYNLKDITVYLNNI